MLYFNSDRPGGIGAWDIYSAKRDWEYNPSLTPDGQTIVFASNRLTGQGSDL